ncbi:MAG TPA: hypothetical protein PLL09_02035 [Flavobacterium sp.]|uniref:hypothetical protein n=1 Tax=unclassified Flavobacterium TaxID=196869 RepID=UPI000E8C6FDD|nr:MULTISPECIES: hypothetical protein [unclassified Flavobacterium]HBI00310.1 hypothetical protein [Flavobacterium sp.]HRE76584.1 hypothetical protein [Flavobacterium sp.]
MKKIFIVLLTISTFLSCESDDGITYVTPDYLSGKWVWDQIGAINAQNVLVYQSYVNDEGCEKNNLILNNNGSYEKNDFQLVGSVCENSQQLGSYELNNNILSLSYIDEEEEEENQNVTDYFTIISLTYTEIQISYTDKDTDELVFLKLIKEEE